LYCCFVDVAKACDTVWLDGLWWKLRQAGVRGATWRLLRHWYANTSSVGAVEGTTTRPFALKQGVKQGSVLSPILYAAFIDSIVTELKEAQLGATIHEEWVGALLYADDMVFSEWEPERLQRMIDVLDEHARTWRYEPSATKTKILATLGPTEYQWHLRGTPLRLR
jgi:hypothetical protein